MKTVATFYGRDIEGNLEFSDDDYKFEKIYNHIESLYRNRKLELREKYEKEIGIVDNTDNIFTELFDSYKNDDEINNLVDNDMKKEGYSKQYKTDGFSITETSEYKCIITYGRDFGFDMLGDICCNFEIKVEIFQK